MPIPWDIPDLSISITHVKYEYIRQYNRIMRDCTCEHENRRFWKLELINQQILHALGVVDAALELVPGVLIRYPTDHGLLPPGAPPAELGCTETGTAEDAECRAREKQTPQEEGRRVDRRCE